MADGSKGRHLDEDLDVYADGIADWLRTNYRIRPPEDAIAQHLAALREVQPSRVRTGVVSYRIAFVAACLILVAGSAALTARTSSREPVTTNTAAESPVTAPNDQVSSTNTTAPPSDQARLQLDESPSAGTITAGPRAVPSAEEESTAVQPQPVAPPSTIPRRDPDPTTSQPAPPSDTGVAPDDRPDQTSRPTTARSPATGPPRTTRASVPPSTRPDHQIKSPTCNGFAATIVGGNGRQIIHGTAGPDVIVGGNGKDTIYGHGGDDIICGGNGKDSLFGGAGNDTLIGGNGKDELIGGLGRDSLIQ